MMQTFKALLRSQGLALASNIIKGSKNKKSPLIKVLIGLLVLYVIGAAAVMFGYFFMQICEPFHLFGIDWLYFAMAGLLALVIMFVFSVFMTAAQLFEAKDNELLLAMPIPTSFILASRMIVLYAFNFAMELFIVVPVAVIYISKFGFDISKFIIACLIFLTLPFLSLTLSGLMGWIIASISSRVRNKSLMTMLFSLVFLGLYFWGYSQMNSYIQKLIANGDVIAKNVKGAAVPVFWFGNAIAQGNWGHLVFMLICELVPFMILYILLSRSFIKIATTKRGFAKVEYKEKEMKVGTTGSALLTKELRHFVNSPMYMLNGALGTVFILVAAGALVVKKELIIDYVARIPQLGNSLGSMIIILLSVMSTINIVSAPSISLEGKNLWIVRSMPIRTRDILMSKVYLHLVVTIPALLIAEIVAAFTLDMDVANLVLLFVLPNIVCTFCALFGVVVNLKFPKFDWISETVAVKQSASTMISMFGAFAIFLIPAVLYIVMLNDMISIIWFLGILSVIYIMVCAGLYEYLIHKGCKVLESL